MSGDFLGFFCVAALLHNRIARAIASPMKPCGFFPSGPAYFQAVENLAEVELVQFDFVFSHISADTPGQVLKTQQALFLGQSSYPVGDADRNKLEPRGTSRDDEHL